MWWLQGLATFNGLHFLTEEEQAHLNTSLLPLHANLAAALYHLQDYPKAIENARKVRDTTNDTRLHDVLILGGGAGPSNRPKAREGHVQTWARARGPARP